MTTKESKNYNLMLNALHTIIAYLPSHEILTNSEDLYGLEPTEALEMAYDNIQSEAKSAINKLEKL
jgi:hypothetical protein